MAKAHEIPASEANDVAARGPVVAASEAQPLVNPANTQPKGVVRWGWFLVLNAVATVIAVGLFIAVLFADWIDPYLRGMYEWLLAHPGVTSFAAFSPLLASLLVGWGYSQRARKRKAAAARAEAERAKAAAAAA